jgi:hypothetical protein
VKPGGKANSVPIPRKPRITTSMISAPQPNSFVHIAHVGISEKGIEATKDVDPRWTTLLKELSGHGVTRSVCEEHLQFIEGFLAGAKSVGGSPVEKKAKGQLVSDHPRCKPLDSLIFQLRNPGGHLSGNRLCISSRKV